MRKTLFLIFVLFFAGLSHSQTRMPRSYTADIIKNPDSTKTYEFHVGHINFRNSLGRFRPINTTLTWRPLLKVWQQDSASYMCRIPQYADGLFTFVSNYEGSDYTLRASPMCAHVAGTLLDDDGSGQSVYYADAFGAGIDLRVWATRHGLLKVIIIKERPASITADMHFDFQIIIPLEARLEAIRNADGTLWDKESDLSFRDRLLKLGEAGKEIYFNPALVWDSAGNTEPVDIKIYRSALKYYMRKTVTAAFLESATYPVYTDHPTDFAPGAGDGFVGRSNAYSTWSTERSASDAETADYTSTSATYMVEYGCEANNTVSLCRGFFPFNTSTIGAGETVTAASFYFYASSKTSVGGDYDYINVQSSTQASLTQLGTGDYNNFLLSPGADSLYCANKSVATIATNAYTEMAFDADGIAGIKKGAYTKLVVRSGFDIENQSPDCGSEQYGRVVVYYSENTGSYDPKLTVTVASSYAGAMIFVE
jgi:hypothetical protein